MVKEKLTPEAWIEAGLSQLAAEGPQALRAEPLARFLKTTKGSFYWHFKDVPAYHAALLAKWQTDCFANVMRLIEDEGPVSDRLRKFGEHVANDDIDSAIRAWSQSDPSVAQFVAQVDAERLKYISALLSSLGVTNDHFAWAAYAMLLGQRQVMGSEVEGPEAYGSLIDLILALR